MRLISWFDWAQFVESTSVVDNVLRTQGSFGRMDFATRDRYRHAVESLARRAGLTEVEVATSAVAMARAAPVSSEGESAARSDPGFYLIAEGLPRFEAALGIGVPLATRLRRAYARGATTGYLGTIAAATGLIVAVPLLLSGGVSTAGLLLLALLALGPASDLAIALVNRTVTDVLGPASLSRLDLDDGVPSAMRTLVVVPTLLTSEADVEAQVNQLEVHFLGNREGDLRFALLSDWVDAPAERVDGDDEILAAAITAVDRLNERHGEAPGGGARFLLFQRERRWNEAEGSWIGWERKRGKLHELNELLRGSTTTGILATSRPFSGRRSFSRPF
jgi:cyclic beta-1,2-glucan synthetase